MGALSCAGFGAAASAQTVNSQDAKQQNVEEIIVTAQRRAERLQEIPIAISVLNGDVLDSSTRQGAWDALAKVPGVAVFAGGNFDISSLNVRGVTTNALFAGSTPVAYYLDSVPWAFVQSAFVPDAGVYDLERIETLRGPQGTLYGANALNGVVRVLTREVDLDELEFKARTSVAATPTSDGDESYRADAAINVPLIEGKLAVRAVGGYQEMGGWIDTPIEENANNNTLKNFRLKVKAAPTEKLTIGLSGWWSETEAGSTNNSADDYTRTNNWPEPQRNEFEAYSADIDYDFGFAQLTSRTSRLNYSLFSVLDFVNFCNFECPPAGSHMDADVFSQEITLASTGKGVWRWTLGGMYRDAEDSLLQGFEPIVVPLTDHVSSSESAAVFGELTRVFMDGRFELTGGLRYFRDKVEMKEKTRTNFEPPDYLITTGRTFDKVTPRVALTWHPREYSTVYVSYSQGFRSGLEQGPNITRTFGSTELPSTKPDTLTNYELGAKSTFMGGVLDVEVAVFHIDWADVQQQITVPYLDSSGHNLTASALLNGGSASGLGADAVITWRPIVGLAISGNFSWNDLEFDDDPAPGTDGVFLKGDRINNSPEYTAGGSIDYAFPISGTGVSGHVSTSAVYRGEYTYKSASSAYFDAGSRLIARAEAGVDLSSAWSINAYVDNLTNDYTPGEDVFGVPSWTTRPRPRTYGLQVEYRL